MDNLLLTLILLIAFGTALFFIRQHYVKLLNKEIKRAQKSEQLKSVFIDNISRTLRSAASSTWTPPTTRRP